MKKKLLVLALLIFFPLISMRKRPNEEIAEQKVEEPKVARTTEPAQEQPVARGQLSNEMGAEILKNLAKAKSTGATLEQKLYNAVASIRNFMNAFPQFYGDEKINGELIRELANRYALGNQIKVATALATTGAGQWMAKFIDTDIQKRAFLTAQFVNAAENGDAGRLRFIITFVPQIINQGIGDSVTALMAAALNGHTVIVNQLLQVPGINVNMQTYAGGTALMFASQKGYTAVVERLLQAPGINVNLQNQHGGTALRTAAFNGHTAVVERLLQVPGINVNLQNSENDTALMMAAENGHAVIVERLLQVPGINVNLQKREGATALMLAAQNGHTAVLEKLLAVPGINVNLQNQRGITSLGLAAKNGHVTAVERLLQAPGIDVNIQSPEGYTALMGAAYMGRMAAVERLLQAPGINVNLRSGQGTTALSLARQFNGPAKDALIKLLIAHGATE